MPIRINLKELFSFDGQAITVDKINFNFNKLLELGIGLPGGIGLTGPGGSAGPVGLTGGPGTRGATWFVGTGDPNSNTFPDLLDNDFFIDTITSTIWQYDLATDTWVIVVDLEAVVNNFLTAAGSPFVRGFGESSPDDNRYIVFSNHGNNNSDVLQDTTLGNSSNNDIFFLNNFNEKFTSIINFPLDTNDEYNALQKIYTDNTSGIPGRYHLELGALYADGADKVLSQLKENLKVRFLRNDITSTQYPLSNNHLNIARFSLSVPEPGTGFSSSDIDYNSLFEFVSPKYNNNDTYGGVIQGVLTTRIGSRESLGEISNYVTSDGILFSLDLTNSHASIGLTYNYKESLLPSINDLDYLMIDHSSNVEAIFLNNKVYQDNGSIIQLGTSLPEQVDTTIATFSPTVTTYGRMGMAVSGHILFTVSHSGANVTNLITDFGFFNMYDIQNPNKPVLLKSSKNVGLSSVLSVSTDICDLGASIPYGSGVSDVELFDNIAYIVNNLSTGQMTDPAVSGGGTFTKRPFNILRLDYNQGQFFRISDIGYSQEFEGLNKIKLYNNYAITVSKNSATTVSSTGPTYNEGRINAINIGDKDTPILTATASQPRTNYLALDVIEDYAVTLTFEQGTLAGPDPSYVRVYVDVFDLKRLNPDLRNFNNGAFPQTINLLYSTRTQASAFINNGITTVANWLAEFPIEKQLGAITGNINDLYVGYHNKIKKFNLRQNTCYNTFGPPPAYFNLAESLSFDATNDSYHISDMKLVGNDLYILSKLIGSSGANTVTLTKFDMSDPLVPFKVYQTGLPAAYDSAARFMLIGKNVYLCTGNGDGGIALSTLELDGINTGTGEIRSLRSNNVHITDELVVGDNAVIHNKLSVGKGGIYSNRLNTNQIWGKVQLIDGTSLSIVPNNNAQLNQFSYDDGLGTFFTTTRDITNTDRTILNCVSSSTFISPGGIINLFSLAVTPVDYDRRLMWEAGGGELFYPTNHRSYMFIQYGYGTNTSSYTEYRRRLVYNAYDGDEILIPAGFQLIMIVNFSGLVQFTATAANSFIFRAEKIGLGAISAPILVGPPSPPGPGGPGT